VAPAQHLAAPAGGCPAGVRGSALVCMLWGTAGARDRSLPCRHPASRAAKFTPGALAVGDEHAQLAVLLHVGRHLPSSCHVPAATRPQGSPAGRGFVGARSRAQHQPGHAGAAGLTTCPAAQVASAGSTSGRLRVLVVGCGWRLWGGGALPGQALTHAGSCWSAWKAPPAPWGRGAPSAWWVVAGVGARAKSEQRMARGCWGDMRHATCEPHVARRHPGVRQRCAAAYLRTGARGARALTAWGMPKASMRARFLAILHAKGDAHVSATHASTPCRIAKHAPRTLPWTGRPPLTAACDTAHSRW